MYIKYNSKETVDVSVALQTNQRFRRWKWSLF